MQTYAEAAAVALLQYARHSASEANDVNMGAMLFFSDREKLACLLLNGTKVTDSIASARGGYFKQM